MVGECNHGFQPIVLDDPLADIALAAASVAGEEWRTVKDDADAARKNGRVFLCIPFLTNRVRKAIGKERPIGQVRHGAAARVMDDPGDPILHTPELVTKLFDEELDRILRELPTMKDLGTANSFRLARMDQRRDDPERQIQSDLDLEECTAAFRGRWTKKGDCHELDPGI